MNVLQNNFNDSNSNEQKMQKMVKYRLVLFVVVDKI